MATSSRFQSCEKKKACGWRVRNPCVLFRLFAKMQHRYMAGLSNFAPGQKGPLRMGSYWETIGPG